MIRRAVNVLWLADLMNALRKLANKSKAAIVFAHHSSKGNQSGKESQDRISGSGVWGRAVDIKVSRVSEVSQVSI